MKKVFLLIFALVVGVTAMGQRKLVPGLQPFLNKKAPVGNVLDQNYSTKAPVTTLAPPRYSDQSPTAYDTSVLFGGSVNAFTLLLPEQTCMWYDKPSNTIMATYRGNQVGTIWTMGTGDDILNHFSTDGGLTWTHIFGVSHAGYRHRYPSGVTYNPTASSNPGDIFSVLAGPRTDGSVWLATYEASVKYGGTDSISNYYPTTTEEINRCGLTSSTNGTFHFWGVDYNNTSAATLYEFNGTWDGGNNKVNWTPVIRDMTSDFIIDPSSGSVDMFFGPVMSDFKKDGSVGYRFLIGCDARPTVHTTYVPIIYKTTDNGTTWEKLPFFDFGSLPAIQEHIFPTFADPNVYAPFFQQADIVVDGMGLPHIFAAVQGGYSTNIDSLGYIYVGGSEPDQYPVDLNAFEIYMDENSNWHAVWIDSIVTGSVDVAHSWYTSSTGNVGWDWRMQASKSDDGSKVFATWTDSDYLTFATTRFDLNPDLKIWGRDVYSYLNTPVVNVTANTPVWGLIYFHFTSPVAMDDGGTYTIPVAYSDIITSGKNADNPTYHYFLHGVTLRDLDFTLGGTSPIAESQNTQVTGVYPNPVVGLAHVDITVPQASNVSLSVTNVTGQTLINTNLGSFSAGSHTLTFDAANLSSGVYFCTVKIGEKQYTNKMIGR